MAIGDTTLGGPTGDFPKTVAELLAEVQNSSEEARRPAVEELCRRYWKPTYSYIRLAWSKSNEEAKDLTQGFFLWVLEGGALQAYEKDRASFRTYLKLLLKHFVNRQGEAMERLKRGGGVRILPLNQEDLSLEGALPDPASVDPERLFDLAWRRDLLARAVDRVRRRYRSADRVKHFRAFEGYDLCPSAERPTYQGLADTLGVKATDIHNYLFAIREEVREEVRVELSRMSSTPEQFGEEWNAFINS